MNVSRKIKQFLTVLKPTHALFCGLVLFPSLSIAMELQAIPQQQVHALQEQFKISKAPQLKQVADKNWSCELFGMRSRLVVLKQNHFYRFSKASGHHLHNNGAQIVKNYRVTSNEWIGHVGPIMDRVRLSNPHTLISELSIPRRMQTTALSDRISDEAADLPAIGHPRRVAVAYTVCQAK